MTNLVRLPGLIDAHVHLRDPGTTHKEDFYTGTSAALAGGIVAILDMPNNPLPTTSLKSLERKKLSAAKKCVCDYGFYFGANNRNWRLHKQASKKSFGLKVYMDHTTGSLLIENLKLLERHFANWPKHKPILVHAEDSTLAKAIGLAVTHNKWLHVCHVSQECELEMIKKAKRLRLENRGFKVTCEVAPHHLFLTKKNEKQLGSFAKMRPPLQTKQEQQSLWKGLRNGIIDCIATDHAPHTIKGKKSKNPPNGVPGLETMLPLMLTAVSKGQLTMKRLIQLTHTTPSRLFGIKTRQSWIEVDLDKKYKIDNNSLKTKCGWSPFNNREVRGKVVRVFIRGTKVFEEGEILVEPGFGKPLTCKPI